MKIVFLTLVFALVISSPPSSTALAQANQDTPEAAAKAYMEATRAGDWAKCASLMHPDALKQIRGLFGPIISDLKTEKDKQEIESIFGVKDKAEFDKLSDEELWVKFSNVVMAISPEVKKMLTASSFEIVGQVQQTPDLVHVVYRMHLKIEGPELKAPIPFTKLDVMSLKRFGNAWRADLKGDLQAFIQALAVGMANSVEEKEKGKSAPAGAGKPAGKP